MNSMISKTLLAATLSLGTMVVSPAIAAEGFTITSEAFSDNAILDSRYAAKGGPRNCDGENVSPPFSWTNAPAGTKSFAIVASDSVGRHGLGVDHWVLYNIGADTTSMAEGTIPPSATGGKNSIGSTAYFGPCPDVGDNPHHYEFTLLAIDMEPGALAEGLSRDDLLDALKEHSLGATSIVARYARH